MTEGQRATRYPVLDRIVSAKTAEVEALHECRESIERQAAEALPAKPVTQQLVNRSTVALLAEVKRRSPGAGAMDPALDPSALAAAYERGGAFAISVLTDGPFFGGTLDDLKAVKASVQVPVLRKDFVIDELQVLEARGAGADLVLLIARILSPERLGGLRRFVHELGMTALVEVHDASEVPAALDSGAHLIGINNRDLSNFTTDLQVTLELVGKLPPEVAVISESGIATADDVQTLAASGVNGVLVGEALVRSRAPEAAAGSLSAVPVQPRGR